MRRPIVALALALVLPLPVLAGPVIVKEGETLSEIADRLGIPMSRLMKLNGISDPDLVEAGRRLRLSGPVAAAARPAGGSGGFRRGASEHVVRPGESLSTIADGYGVPLSRLVAINAIGNPDHVEAGTRLKLKGSPAAAPVTTPKPRPAAASRPAPKPASVASARPTATAGQISPARTPATVAPATATATATAPRPAGGGLATTPTGGKPDWRTYGPLQVDWANWQPMGGSMVAPTLNGEGQSLYLAINCTARKLNATSQAGQWKTWDDPQADFEQQLVNDLCKARS
ncbi:MAG: LysM peptidoglycan-binding domain-containing protein [Synechococcaceae cyanobacterium]